MKWENILKSDLVMLKETARIVQLLRNSMVGSENQTMSPKDVDMYLKSIKENILKVQERLK